jgi:hypothetical protein
MGKTIALDYDGTFTADPALWLAFIEQAQKNGHRVICVTMRYEHELDNRVFNTRLKELVEIFATGRKAKKTYMQKQDQMIDIWIDDNPNFLYEDASS